ncbi:Acetolactate synthase large subunit [subsurface metagenome]
MTKASERICDVLIEAGIDHVFGIPGGGTMPIWDALFDRQDRIRVVLTRHEQSAACMADMYGRMTGRPGVLIGQGAFIASSGGFGILEGYLSNSPMLVLADTSDSGFSQHGNYQSGSGEYGSFDIVGILRSMSKYTTYAVTPGEAVQGIQLAIKHAMAGRPGPSCVVMRNNAISGEIDLEGVPKIYATSGYLKESLITPPAEDIEKASRLLLEAQRPVVIAGNGVHISRAYKELRELAECLGAPVATSSTGKSTFPEVHPLALGMMGTFGQRVANDIVADADLLLVAGCRLSPSDTKYENPQLIDPSRQRILQIDIDPRNTGWTFPVEMGLVGDLKTVLSQLLDTLKRLAGGKAVRAKERLEALEKRKNEEDFFEAAELHSDASPLLPQRIVREIEEAVSGSTIITLDAGNNRLWMVHFFRSKEVRTVFCPGGIAGMGWGPPAALTAKLLHPDRTVLSVSSDGGFAMMTHVLSTAVQYRLPVTFLVMNNSGLGMVRDGQAPRGRIIASEFVATDFAQIARAFGCQGVNVRKAEELGPAIKEAFRASMPTVIDVATSSSEPYFKIASLWGKELG